MSNKLPASNLSRVDEEPNEWANEKLPPLMDTNEQQYEDQEQCVSKKTPKVPLIQLKAGWLGNKQAKSKTREDTDEESNGSGLPSYHTSPSPTSSSESEGDVEYEASSPSQP